MTQEQATQEAVAFANRTNLVIGNLISVRLRRADEFYGPGSGKNDIWIVRFEKLLPNDVAVESPSSIILEVDDQTRETSQFDTL
jgi:hypothetical protein